MTFSSGVIVVIFTIFSLAVCVIDERPVVIVVSFDGFRYDYLKQYNLTKLNSLKTAGTYSEYMINVFETKTFPNHQSIATGLYPESHGVISNSVYDPKYGKVIHYGPELYEYDGIVPIWILNELLGNESYSGVMMWPGGEFPYGNTSDGIEALSGKKIYPTFHEKWNVSVPWKYRVDTIMSWITHPTTPTNLVMLYFEEPDMLSHAYGPDSEVVARTLEELDQILTYLSEKIDAMNLANVVNVILVSDHGMQTVTPSRIINLNNSVDTSLFTTATSSPVLHIYPKEGNEENVYRQLVDSKLDHFKVYRKNELPERWHVSKSRRTPPILALANEGYVFQDFYNSMDYYQRTYNRTPSANQTYGVHGYDNAVSSMHPIFVAWGPLIKEGFVIEPFSSIDIFPLLLKMLNLPNYPNNGTLTNVSGMLRAWKPFSSRQISPVVWIALWRQMETRDSSAVNLVDLVCIDVVLFLIVGGIAAIAVVIVAGAGVVTSKILTKRKPTSGYDRKLEQNQYQSILQEMGIEEQRLLSDSEED